MLLLAWRDAVERPDEILEHSALEVGEPPRAFRAQMAGVQSLVWLACSDPVGWTAHSREFNPLLRPRGRRVPGVAGFMPWACGENRCPAAEDAARPIAQRQIEQGVERTPIAARLTANFPCPQEPALFAIFERIIGRFR
jgi:hypothetical protein